MAMRLDAEHSASDQSQAEEPLLAVSLLLCRNRNISERMLRRPKNFRRNAKRYDLNASDFLVAACIAATVSYWFLSQDNLSLSDDGGSWGVGPAPMRN